LGKECHPLPIKKKNFKIFSNQKMGTKKEKASNKRYK
jgi:hypothetical protein